MAHFMRLASAYSALCMAAAAVSFSNAFSSNAVLQRDVPVMVWGFTDAAVVNVTLQPAGTVVTASVDGNGVWRAQLPAMPASLAPVSVTAAAGNQSVTLSNVLVGEVLLCSGQSNMGLPVSVLPNVTDVVAAAPAYANVRLFQPSGNVNATTPQLNFTTDGLTLWTSPLPNGSSNSTLLGYSAVCYVAATTLYDTLGGNVPVGAIASAHGGTSIQAWTSPAYVYSCGDRPVDGWNASILYNSNIYPLVLGPLTMRAVVWYQGEEDCGLGPIESYWRAGWYGCALQALIADWRQRFNAPALPFVVQQLHAWIHCNGCDLDIGLPLLRQVQLKALQLPNVGYSTAFDGGDPTSATQGNPGGTVHPHNKFIPGRRLAATLAGQFIGLDVPYLHPQYADAIAISVSNATSTYIAVNISFVPGTTGTGLVQVPYDPYSNSSHCPTERAVNISSCDWFGIQTNDNSFTWWNASVAIAPDGHGLTLSVTVPMPGLAAVATRNGYADWPVVTIYNSNNFPVLPWMRTITL